MKTTSIFEKLTKGVSFKISSNPNTIFKVVKVDAEKDRIDFKVVDGGRKGQINRTILSDLISMNSFDIF